MVFEDKCDNCGRFLQIRYCSIRKINVCVDCCLVCNQRSACKIRVWAYNLLPKKQSVRLT
ncbi:hypothetical protein KN1_18460 [Stygiolobus caldivivus]|uniref:Uncharacterized protein n=1 Tax=Stygiolobus caldivivus TaxID=2824673 RepID=A0A8D5U750_9CREN|nr:hypothetical protein KN1_18460 [Stygiolobus caldivivus]